MRSALVAAAGGFPASHSRLRPAVLAAQRCGRPPEPRPSLSRPPLLAVIASASPSPDDNGEANSEANGPAERSAGRFAIAARPDDGRPMAASGKLRRCRRCRSSGSVACSDCKGSGALSRGGYHSQNQVQLPKIIGSKWTTLERTLGYNFFTATQRRKEGKDTYILMTAAGDTAVKFWVNAKNLKDRGSWGCGWLGKDQIASLSDKGPTCRRCDGTGLVECSFCSTRPGDVVFL